MFSIGIDPFLIVRNVFFWIVIGVNLFFIAIYLIFMYNHKYNPRPPLPQNFLNSIYQENKVIIGFVGDIMPTGKYNMTFSRRVIKFFTECDLIVGNLEGIMVKDITYKKIGKRISTQRHTYSILNLLLSLGKAPKNWLLCVSNNHSGDLGIAGFIEMIGVLKEKQFNIFGDEDNPTFFYNTKDFLVNLVAGTMWSNYRKCRFVSRFGCAGKYHEDIAFNILFPHWHYENEPYIRPFMGEKSRNFLQFGKYKKDKEIEKYYNNPTDSPNQPGLKEWDFVFGHHSHTPQPIEIFSQQGIRKVLAYSGGNFTSGKGRKKHRKGMIAKIVLGKSTELPNRIVVEKLAWRYTYNF